MRVTVHHGVEIMVVGLMVDAVNEAEFRHTGDRRLEGVSSYSPQGQPCSDSLPPARL